MAPSRAYVHGNRGAILRETASLHSPKVGVLESGLLVRVVAVSAEPATGAERWRVREAASGATGWASAKVLAGVADPAPALPSLPFEGDAVRWLRGAKALAAAARAMRARGRDAWVDGMRLAMPSIERDLRTNRPFAGPSGPGSPYAGAHAPRYEKLSRELYETASAAFATKPASPLRRVLEAVERECAGVSASRQAGGEWWDRVGPPYPMASKRRPDGWPEAPDTMPAWLRMVALPLALYVRNTVQLYGLLAKLHGLRKSVPSDLEAHLDEASDPPSAYLLFSILAALQILKRARRDAHSLEALATTSAGPACAVGGPGPFRPPPFCAADDGAEFAYRGLWVDGAGPDDRRVRHSSSFQSYSRHVPGVAHVLRFYAGSRGTEVARMAGADAHVLLLIAKGWRSNDLVTPVEYFNDGALGGIERELLLPPFVALDFDVADDVVITVPALGDAAAGLARLERAHGWTPCEHLRGILRGDVTLRGSSSFPEAARKVTLRFVTSLRVAPPMRALLDEPDCLYAFPEAPKEDAVPKEAPESPLLAPFRACLRRSLTADVLARVRESGYAIVDRAIPQAFCEAAVAELRRLRARRLMVRNRSYSVASAEGDGAADAPAANRRRLDAAAANDAGTVAGTALKKEIWETEPHRPGTRAAAPMLSSLLHDRTLVDAVAPLFSTGQARTAALRLQVNDGVDGCFGFHCDSVSNLDDRQLTALFYLNKDWDAAADGGALVLLPYPAPPIDIDPLAGRLVLFDARYMLHATRPARMPRYCFTAWIAGERVAPPRIADYDDDAARSTLDFRPSAAKLAHAAEIEASLKAAHEDSDAVVRDHRAAVASIRGSVDVAPSVLEGIYRTLPYW